MDSKIYWRKREEENLKSNLKTEAEHVKALNGYYDNMLDQIQKEINSFYGRYANKEGITLSEAKKRVAKLDIEAYERKAKRYVKEKDFSDRANEEMRLYNLTMKVNRLEMLKANIGTELVSGHEELQKFYGEVLQGRTMEELERQAGILGKTIQNNAETANAIVNASFHNATFSDRIWMYQDIMKAELSKLLQTGLIQGKNPNVLARDLRKLFDVRKSDAERLMRTELARVQIEAQKQSFERNGYDQYIFIALGSACDKCKPLDNGKPFDVDKMMPGKNAPPMHPNCRCSTAAYMDREEFDNWLDFLDKGGTTDEWNKRKGVVNSRKGGIIKDKNLYRYKNRNKIEPMPKTQLRKILKAFKRQGGTIQMSAETDGYLNSKSAEGITYNENTILLHTRPGRASVYEELIHATQWKNGEIDGSYVSRLRAEIKAQKKLIKYQHSYKLTEKEVKQTEKTLSFYQKELDRIGKEGE